MAYGGKRSIRRASFYAMNCPAWKSFTSPAMRASKLSAGKRVIGPMPDLPANIARQLFSVPMPRGETSPVPVMTTRRSDTVSPLRGPSGRLGPVLPFNPSLLVVVDVVDGVSHGFDVFRFFLVVLPL